MRLGLGAERTRRQRDARAREQTGDGDRRVSRLTARGAAAADRLARVAEGGIAGAVDLTERDGDATRMRFLVGVSQVGGGDVVATG